MSQLWNSAAFWTAQSLIAGGTAILLGWLAARRISDPAGRHRAMTWSVRAAVSASLLAFLPAWWQIQIPSWAEPVERNESTELGAVHSRPISTTTANEVPVLSDEFIAIPTEPEIQSQSVALIGSSDWDMELIDPVVAIASVPAEPESQSAPVEEVQTESSRAQQRMMTEIAPVLLVPYWLCVAFTVARQVIGYIGLTRLRRSAKPAPARILDLARSLHGHAPMPSVLVSERMTTPVCFGVVSPTILLPRSLVQTASDDQLRWVLAHELNHLQRKDPRTGVWVGLARSLYFVLPWFWVVRREIQLTQEYLADAAAAGAQTTDYAAFLVELSSRPGVSRVVKAVPSLAGVRAGQSDLYRRVTMLLEPKNGRNSRWSRAWTTLAIGSAVSAAVALSGVSLTADEPKKTELKKVEQKQVDGKLIHRDGDSETKETKGDIQFVVIRDGSKETKEIEQAIEAAAQKGDVETVKKLVAKLKALSSGVASVQAKPSAPAKPPVPPAPPVPAVPGIVVRPTTVTVDADASGDKIKFGFAHVSDEVDAKKIDQAIEKLKQAAEQLKENPEAKAAIEKTIAQFQKTLAEAKVKKAQDPVKPANVAKAIQLSRVANIEQLKKELELLANQQKKLLDELNEKGKLTDAGRESFKKLMDQMQALNKQLQQSQETFLFQGQGQFQGVPPIAQLQELGKPVFLIGNGVEEKGRLGITIEPVPEVIVEQLDLSKGQGVIVAKVFEGTPAAKAGLKTNDIILEINGKAITLETLPKVVSSVKNDDSFDVIILRKGKKETVKGVVIPTPPTSKDTAKKSSQTSMSVSVNGDQYEIVAKEENVAYTIRGTVGDDSTAAITIVGGGKSQEFKGLKSVPAAHREKVGKLLKSVGGN